MAKIQDITPAYLQFAESDAPAAPATGVVRVYAKADGKLYCKDDAGTEYALVGAAAAAVSIADSGSHYTATDVEGALAELFTSVSDGKTLVAAAITDKGVTTAATDSFDTMATNIENISAGGGTEPDEYTKVLLHFDGDNANTTITDEIGKTWTASGNAALTTAIKGYGTASLALDGTGDFISTPGGSDFDFGTGDFTIDFWINPNTVSLDRHSLYTQYDDASNWIQLSLVATGVYFYTGNGIEMSVSGVVIANAWQHIALVRSGTNFYIFVNGQQKATISSATSMPSLTGNIVIGARKYTGTEDRYANAYIDEYRVSKGIARWTSNFAPGNSY